MALTQREIAAHLRLSPGMVNRLIKQGMPSDSLDGAAAWRAANVRVRDHEPRSASTRNDRRTDAESAEDFATARARRESTEADIAQLKRAEMQRDLVSRVAVEQAEARKASAVRESLLQLPSQMAPVMAAESDMGRCFDLLTDAVLGVLAKISGKAP